MPMSRTMIRLASTDERRRSTTSGIKWSEGRTEHFNREDNQSSCLVARSKSGTEHSRQAKTERRRTVTWQAEADGEAVERKNVVNIDMAGMTHADQTLEQPDEIRGTAAEFRISARDFGNPTVGLRTRDIYLLVNRGFPSGFA